MTTASIDSIVHEMRDRELIRDLPQLYCHYVWQGDVERLVNLFTQDAWFEDGRHPRAQGRENLRKLYTEAMKELEPRPFIHNHVIELKGPDRATGNCYLDLRATRDGESLIAAAYYDDEYVKVGDEWKFKSRKMTPYFFGPLKEGWAHLVAKKG